jgi:hypothetical protein
MSNYGNFTNEDLEAEKQGLAEYAAFAQGKVNSGQPSVFGVGDITYANEETAEIEAELESRPKSA